MKAFHRELVFEDALAAVTSAVQEPANLHAVGEYRIVEDIVFDCNLPNLIFHRAVGSVKLARIGGLRDLLNRLVKFLQQIRVVAEALRRVTEKPYLTDLLDYSNIQGFPPAPSVRFSLCCRIKPAILPGCPK